MNPSEVYADWQTDYRGLLRAWDDYKTDMSRKLHENNREILEMMNQLGLQIPLPGAAVGRTDLNSGSEPSFGNLYDQ